MKCLFLYNPNSGKGNVQTKLPLIERMLSSRYDEVVLYATKSAEDLQQKVAKGASAFDTIVFAGGDGTFNLVLSALGDREVKLGYLPSGTANDVARSLKIPKNTKRALKVILNGRCEKVDCMRVNEKDHAIYVVAAGAFTGVTYSTPQKKKRRLGWFAYAFECLKSQMKFDSFPVEIACGERRERATAVLILIMNGRSVARFYVNRKASMQDGKIEIALLRARGNLGFFGRLRAFFEIIGLFLFGCHRENKHLLYLNGDSVFIHADDNVVWDLDGEKGDTGDLSVRLLKGRVNLFVPKNKKI